MSDEPKLNCEPGSMACPCGCGSTINVMTVTITPVAETRNYRTWCWGLVRECDIAETPPGWFGRCWNVPARNSMVCALMPLNLLLGWVRNLVLRVKVGVPPLDTREAEELARATAAYVGRASGKLAAYIERVEIRRQIVRNYECRN